jgi:uncharacterized YigZ family protein
LIKYRTVGGQGIAESTVEKSRFIGHIQCVDSKEAAEAFFFEIRERHKMATHNVPAFVIGDVMQLQWASDDGEPQGTSGAPIVQLLVSEGLTNAAVLVTRYYGGTKLGTGGLVRAYTAVAKAAIKAAGICEVMSGIILRCELEYRFFDKLKYAVEQAGIILDEVEYTDKIRLNLAAEFERKSEVDALLRRTCGSGAHILTEQETEFRIPVPTGAVSGSAD